MRRAVKQKTRHSVMTCRPTTCAGSPAWCRTSLQYPVRPTNQLVQREDLSILVVLDGVRGDLDVCLVADLVSAYYDLQRPTTIRASLCQPCYQVEGQWSPSTVSIPPSFFLSPSILFTIVHALYVNLAGRLVAVS